MPADTYLFDSWVAHDSGPPDHIEAYGKDWIGPLRSNRKVTYAGDVIRINALAERIDTTERDIEDDTYHIWTKKLPVSQLGDVKLAIAEKETDDCPLREHIDENEHKWLIAVGRFKPTRR
ncbi:hypothetical protein SAMN05216277_11310 [Halolamina pelagica]|uniref:Uncharacterized protein n=1 Tax=Halolamina pelagica TaxID=699431 RepID=A0A1I5ULK1_9EURY|nr:hypothetical protein SAMN05216277_11310 [Halolamina pelagica]